MMKKNTVESIDETLREAISLNWLRPENGLALASYIRYVKFKIPESEGRSLDLACGDGTSSFFKAGGRFDFSFDLYSGGTFSGTTQQDIVDKKMDVFNYVDDTYCPNIVKPPVFKFTHCLDHKGALLNKARMLDFYENLTLGNMNEKLPFEDNYFSFVQKK